MTEGAWALPALNIERSNISVEEFLEWESNDKLELSPEFQRGEVWRNPAKAYLIDTILRDFPIPPLHIRNVSRPGRGLVREVIDGQQRLTAVLQFIRNKFALGHPRASNDDPPPWAGMRWRDLSPEFQDRILHYTFRCEVYRGNIADTLIHEIFSRINIHSVPLSDQELRNGRYFGEFKQAVYSLSREHKDFFRAAGIFTSQAIARMLDAQFISEALVLQIDGMQDKKGTIDAFYTRYDSAWDLRDEHEDRFRDTIDAIRSSCGDVIGQTKFKRVPLFYTLYGVVYHRLFGIEVQRVPQDERPLPETPKLDLGAARSEDLRNAVELLTTAIDDSEGGPLTEFVRATQRQTDNLRPRLARFNTLWDMGNLSEP